MMAGARTRPAMSEAVWRSVERSYRRRIADHPVFQPKAVVTVVARIARLRSGAPAAEAWRDPRGDRKQAGSARHGVSPEACVALARLGVAAERCLDGFVPACCDHIFDPQNIG